MTGILPAIKGLAARVQNLLTGEPLRVIVYGSGVVIFLATRAAVALGYPVDVPSLDAALATAGIAAAVLTEICRRIVSSPNTVAELIEIIGELSADLVESEQQRDSLAAELRPEPSGRRW